MYQHQHAPLPLERLKDVPQPVVVLLGNLLEKDPAQRFQTPNELLRAIPTVTGAIDARRRITCQSLLKGPSTTSRVGKRPTPKKISIARLPVTGSDVFGREEDVAFLDRAWAKKDVNVVTIVAWAGVGKSTLVNHWLRRMAAEKYRSAELVFGWSFYRQGTRAETSSADEFLDAALAWFGDPDPRLGTAWEKGERLAKLIALAQEQNDSTQLVGACAVLASTLHYLGNFEASGQYAIRGVQLWRSIGARSSVVGVNNAARRCSVPQGSIRCALRRHHLFPCDDSGSYLISGGVERYV